ncbi:MAG: 16S rRNA (cytidine(1402)-2'-O)-methyltransferase [Bacilli bacterium]|nr:16S rRNA (cytidine(1402)-2'-O)-methyltransferase [Bacilli bacterium]
MKRIKSYNNSHPVLYLIATPIGNLGEFSSRAIEVINEMDLIAAEDTRNSSELLHKFGIKKPFVSLREHNEVEASTNVISEIKNGKKVAYMSDAGYPGISDPGYLLTKLCLENDIAVSVISGSSAFINALVSSGIDTSHFYFHGFLSAKSNEAKNELEKLKNKKETLCFYESPHRIKQTLNLLYEVLGNRYASLQRELTKLNEEKIYGNLSELIEIDETTLKGEMVIIVSGNHEEETYSEKEIIDKVNYLLSKGLSKKDSIEIVSELFKIRKNLIKDLVN